MNWKLKARIQNSICLLPDSISYSAYYWIQRHFGGLRKTDPTSRLASAIAAWRFIRSQGYDPVGKIFLEIGTGWVPSVPIAFWLMGAKKTVTIDINPYLRAELTSATLKYMNENKESIQSQFGPLLKQSRFNELLSACRDGPLSINDVLQLCCVHYISSGDAAHTNLASQSIDIHTSFRVLEHIPEDILVGILQEGNRIISSEGLFIHRIDYSDHFSHSDTSISKINFLQFSDAEWHKLAGNRLMFMNRMRHDDFLDIFVSAGHEILTDDTDVDDRCAAILNGDDFKLDVKFENKSKEVLATTGAWIISRQRTGVDRHAAS